MTQYQLIITVELERMADDGTIERRGSGIVHDTGTLEHLSLLVHDASAMEMVAAVVRRAIDAEAERNG